MRSDQEIGGVGIGEKREFWSEFEAAVAADGYAVSRAFEEFFTKWSAASGSVCIRDGLSREGRMRADREGKPERRLRQRVSWKRCMEEQNGALCDLAFAWSPDLKIGGRSPWLDGAAKRDGGFAG